MRNTLYEEYIEFETAKLAKQLGYSNGSKTYAVLYKSTYEYDEDPTHPESYKKGQVKFYNDFIIQNNADPGDSENHDYFELPTQALLYKWLREKYNIQINIHFRLNDDNILVFTPSIFFIKERHRFDTISIKPRDTDKTWEICFERCLEVVMNYLINNDYAK